MCVVNLLAPMIWLVMSEIGVEITSKGHLAFGITMNNVEDNIGV